MGVSPQWATQPSCGTGPTPSGWSAAHGRPRLCPGLDSTAGLGNAESSHGLGGTELCWMDAGSPPCPDPAETHCLCDRHSSLLARFKPQHPTDKHQPFLTVAKATSPLRPSYKQAVSLRVPLSLKIPCNEEPHAGKGLSMGLPRSVLLLFLLLLLVRWTVILFFQQPHCQLQWPGRRSDPK